METSLRVIVPLEAPFLVEEEGYALADAQEKWLSNNFREPVKAIIMDIEDIGAANRLVDSMRKEGWLPLVVPVYNQAWKAN